LCKGLLEGRDDLYDRLDKLVFLKFGAKGVAVIVLRDAIDGNLDELDL
jgi:hypothetical protein